jgi:hypothetical protein
MLLTGPNRGLWVNEHRIYDAYTKQARQFRDRNPMPILLPAYPGLDGGTRGHWGSIPWSTWDDTRRDTCDVLPVSREKVETLRRA